MKPTKRKIRRSDGQQAVQEEAGAAGRTADGEGAVDALRQDHQQVARECGDVMGVFRKCCGAGKPVRCVCDWLI